MNRATRLDFEEEDDDHVDDYYYYDYYYDKVEGLSSIISLTMISLQANVLEMRSERAVDLKEAGSCL